jgi:four helix bundle protein
MQINSAKELRVYQKAYRLAMDIFSISRRWPETEKYAMTSQIRRSSRAVCSNLREAWAKRRYEAHFISKLTDADAEINETDTWLDFARDCHYITEEEYRQLTAECRSIGAMLGKMLSNPSPFLITKR